MLSNFSFNRLATTISVAVLSVGLVFGQQASQKSVAQTASLPDCTISPVLAAELNRFKLLTGNNDVEYLVGDIDTFRSGCFPIGATDIPVNPQNGEVRVPVVNSRIVVPYNNGVGSLNQGTICNIFAGNITNFNQVGGPDQPITVVYRSDDSGPKAIFSSYCGGIDGSGAPSKIGVTSSGAVADTVANTPGAIGYVELANANGLPSAVNSPILGPAYFLLKRQYDDGISSYIKLLLYYYIFDNDNLVRVFGYEPLTDKARAYEQLNIVQP